MLRKQYFSTLYVAIFAFWERKTYLYSANKRKYREECERAKGMHAISHIWETPSDAVQQSLNRYRLCL